MLSPKFKGKMSRRFVHLIGKHQSPAVISDTKQVVYNVIIPQESNLTLSFLHRTYGKPASSSRMLHSASIIGRNLVIFGGNTYNGTTSVEKCHSDKISVYNLGKYYKVDYNQQSLYIVISQTFCIFIVNMHFIYICKIIFVRIV